MRIDTGIRAGDEISVHYDPMIAKLIVWGEDRPAAVRRLRAALSACQIAGLRHNVDFLRAIAFHPAFEAGDLDTAFIERHRADLLPADPAPAADRRLGHRLRRADAVSGGDRARGRAEDRRSLVALARRQGLAPERRGPSARSACAATARSTRSPSPTEPDGYLFDLPAGRRFVRAQRLANGDVRVDIEGRHATGTVARVGGKLTVFTADGTAQFELVDPLAASGASRCRARGHLTAPMPGKVIQVAVKPGDDVKRGATLMVLEAMKMEHSIAAPMDAARDGVVEERVRLRASATWWPRRGARRSSLVELVAGKPSRLGRWAQPARPSAQMVEVGPRDGLQNEAKPVPAAAKIALIERLADAGLPVVEAGSFVSPKWVPQMADSAEVHGRHRAQARRRLSGAGAEHAGLRSRARRPRRRRSRCSPRPPRPSRSKNINCSIDESLERFAPVCAAAKRDGMRVRGYVSCVLGCPYEGEIAPAAVAHVSARLLDAGLLRDLARRHHRRRHAGQGGAMIEAVAARVPREQLAVHFHDTYGQALANILAALERGIAVVDSSVAGLGGCPYATGASGNVATEDVLYMLNGLGIETGVDLDKLAEAGQFICAALGRAPGLEGGAGAGRQTQTEGSGGAGMTLHILKLCVGCDSVEDLRQWQQEKLAKKRKSGEKPVLIHWTRMTPKRRDDVLDGGSLYWVIKGYVRVRHRILDLKQGNRDGVPHCGIVYEPKLVQTQLWRSARSRAGAISTRPTRRRTSARAPTARAAASHRRRCWRT